MKLVRTIARRKGFNNNYNIFLINFISSLLKQNLLQYPHSQSYPLYLDCMKRVTANGNVGRSIREKGAPNAILFYTWWHFLKTEALGRKGAIIGKFGRQLNEKRKSKRLKLKPFAKNTMHVCRVEISKGPRELRPEIDGSRTEMDYITYWFYSYSSTQDVGFTKDIIKSVSCHQGYRFRSTCKELTIRTLSW